MGTKAPQPRSAGRGKAADPAQPTREELLARIASLEADLARLGAISKAGMPIDKDRLTTVKVPAQFEVPFLRAQE
jgi:hypothetical protein